MHSAARLFQPRVKNSLSIIMTPWRQLRFSPNWVRTRCTSDASCTGPQYDKRVILHAHWIWNTRLIFVFIERSRDAVCSTYKMAAQTHAVRWHFCQLRKWPPARMPERVSIYALRHARRRPFSQLPVRPLVLIYNSLVWTQFSSFGKLRALFSTSNSRHWRHDSFVARVCLTPRFSEIWLGVF